MAATVANVENLGMAGPGGRWLYGEITLDSAYAVGGESVSAALFGLSFIKSVFIGSCNDGYIPDITVPAGGATMSVKVWVFGNASVSVAQPIESSIKDLSAVVLPVLVRGL